MIAAFGRPRRRAAVLAAAIVLVLAGTAHAQRPTRAELDARFDALAKEKWEKALAAVAAAAGATANGPVATGTPEARQRAYDRALDILLGDQQLMDVFDEGYVQDMVNEESEIKRAESVDAKASNPVMAGFVERSGATSFLALASDLSTLVGADKSAVTINLNALAMVGLKNETVYSRLRDYQRYDALRRLSGTITFGAKIPEQDITGLSGLPAFDTLLDAFAWDVKVRVYGDRDIRAKKWTDLNVRKGGAAVQLLAVIGSSLPATDPSDAALFTAAATPKLGKVVSAIKSEVERSAQLSVKVAGTHLTQEEGKNKLSVTTLFDIGAGPTDFTANVQYANTDDVRLGLEQLFAVQAWTISASLTTRFATGLLAEGRAINWVTGASTLIFQNKEEIPVRSDNTFKVTSSLELPVGGTAKIPLSLVYTNDPNTLRNEKHSWGGQVGVSYDFSAVKELFKKS